MWEPDIEGIPVSYKFQCYLAPGDGKKPHGFLQVDLHRLARLKHLKSDAVPAPDEFFVIIGTNADIIAQHIPPGALGRHRAPDRVGMRKAFDSFLRPRGSDEEKTCCE